MGSNLFVYCVNNPVCFSDCNGRAAKPIGAGIQIEIDIGCAAIVLEIILYWDVEECDNGAPVIAVYAYGGISVDVNNAYIGSILGIITDNADFLLADNGTGAAIMTIAVLISDTFSIGVSGLVILRNEDFKSTLDYEKSFTSVGGSWGKVRGAIAYSESCTVISVGGNLIGGSNIFPSWGTSKTYYKQLFSYTIPNPTPVGKSANSCNRKGGTGLWHAIAFL